MIGRVVSTKMQKTAVVVVERQKEHPLYGKSFVRTKKYLVDDPFAVSDGDIVIFHKVAPISKNKHWRITKVLGRDIVSLEQAELQEAAEEAIEEVMPVEEEEDEKKTGGQEINEKSEKELTGKEEVKSQKAKVKTATKKSKG